MKKSLRPVLLSLAAALAAAACTAAEPRPAGAGVAPVAVREGERLDLEHLNLDRAGLALQGYDPVSYFPVGGSKPREGKAELSFQDRGVTYRFASMENLERFRETPASFEPHYGGWCAYAMADGSKVEVDPEAYLIQNGRLLLFYKSLFNDTSKKWSREPTELEARADEAWSEIVEPPQVIRRGPGSRARLDAGVVRVLIWEPVPFHG